MREKSRSGLFGLKTAISPYGAKLSCASHNSWLFKLQRYRSNVRSGSWLCKNAAEVAPLKKINEFSRV
jgi:hypothetical protein